MRDQGDDVKVLFVFGTEVGSDVTREHKEHCDIVQADFVDSYENVTFDTLVAMKFAMSWPGMKSSLKNLVVADDDVYINLDNLRNHLRKKVGSVGCRCRSMYH